MGWPPLTPRPPKYSPPLQPAEAMRLMEQIIDNFIKKYDVHEVMWIWLREPRDIVFIRLKASSAELHIYSQAHDDIEKITFAVKEKDSTIDYIEVDIDITRDFRKIGDVQFHIEWNYMYNGPVFCLKDGAEFYADGHKAGFKVYSKHACPPVEITPS